MRVFLVLEVIAQVLVLASAFSSNIWFTYSSNHTHRQQVSTLVGNLHKELQFETLVTMQSSHRACLELKRLQNDYTYQPVIALSENSAFYLKDSFNSEVLLLACMHTRIDWPLLKRLVDNVRYMRSSKILLLLQGKAENQQTHLQLFRYFSEKQMLNVVLIYENFFVSGRYYSFTMFPRFAIRCRRNPRILYTSPVKNLHRANFYTMPSQYEPYSIIYTDSRGRLRSSGYLYHFVASFAQKLNATLAYKYPVSVGKHLEIATLANLTYSNDLDVPMCLDTPFAQGSLYNFSNVVEITSWMPMIPKVNNLEAQQFYLAFLCSSFLLLDVVMYFSMSLLHSYLESRHKHKSFDYGDFILNDKVIRGLLGHSFQLVRRPSYQLRMAYILLLYQGNIRSTFFGAYLDTFFTHPPAMHQINSFESLKRHNIKILIPSSEFVLLKNLSTAQFVASYSDIFQTIPNLQEFQALRKSLNTKFAYSVRSTSWMLIHKQQKYFSRRLFAISGNLTFIRYLHMAFPMAENSIYRDAFNTFVGDMHASGLWRHWNTMNFYEMVAAGKMSFKDLSTARIYKPLTLRDLLYVWLLYLALTGLGLLLFIIEIVFKNSTKISKISYNSRLHAKGQQQLATLSR